MKPQQLLTELGRKQIAPVYLFVGPEAHFRQQCRRALVEAALPAGDRENGFVRHDLEALSLNEVLDDARSLSLFAADRLIYVSSAELALPRGKAISAGDVPASLVSYVARPTPGTTVIFDCSRFGLDGDDKSKVDRVRKYYGAIENVVEFAALSRIEATQIGRRLAAAAGLQIGAAELEQLVEMMDGDAVRTQLEIEKLRLYVGSERAVTLDDLVTLTPNARATTIFKLVSAIGQNQREEALDLLQLLVQEGEYLPLALTFAGAQFRLALAAREAKASSAAQIRNHFAKIGIAMWPARSEQVAQTAAAFSAKQLLEALERTHEADRLLRSASVDDQIVMESFVIMLTRTAAHRA